MKKTPQLKILGILLIAVPVSINAQSFTFIDDFESSTVKSVAYAGPADDGRWVRSFGDPNNIFNIAISDNVPDAPGFSTGKELRAGFAYESNSGVDFTLPATTGTWDDSFDYELSINVLTTGPMTGAFNLGARNADDDVLFIGGGGVSINQTAADGWVTYTGTVTAASLQALDGGNGADGLRFFTRIRKFSSGAFMYVDNYSITQIPEPSTSALLFGTAFGAFAFLRRRR